MYGWLSASEATRGTWITQGLLNIKMPPYDYRNFNYKDKTASRPFIFIMEITIPGKMIWTNYPPKAPRFNCSTTKPSVNLMWHTVYYESDLKNHNIFQQIHKRNIYGFYHIRTRYFEIYHKPTLGLTSLTSSTFSAKFSLKSIAFIRSW